MENRFISQTTYFAWSEASRKNLCGTKTRKTIQIVEVNFERLEGAASLFEKDFAPDRLILALSLLVKAPIIPPVIRWKKLFTQEF